MAAGDDASEGGSFCDWEEADASDALVSAFGDHTLPTVAAWWKEVSDRVGVDMEALIEARELDFHGKVRLVNVCRGRLAPAALSGDAEALASAMECLADAATWREDATLVPVLPGDAVLRRLQEDDDDWSDEDDDARAGAEAAASSGAARAGAGAAGSREDGMVTVPASLLAGLRRAAAAAGAAMLGGPLPPAEAPKPPSRGRAGGVSEGGYFGGYAETGIHAEMLQDAPRTDAYRRAIEATVAAEGRGCSVVDIGAGTGILSLFAARAGARATAVEASPLARDAAATAARNGLDERPAGSGRGWVRVVRRRAEEVSAGDLPDARPADAVVSEWMGYALLFEDMLPAVIAARDRLLKPGGRLLPDRATILVAGVSDRPAWRRAEGFWRDAWGFDMSHLEPRERAAAVQLLRPGSLCTEAGVVADLDLLACDAGADLEPAADVELRVTPEGKDQAAARARPVREAGEEGTVEAGPRMLHGLALWFTVAFEGRRFGAGDALGSALVDPAPVLDTSPMSEPTHWQQAVFWLRDPVPLEAVAAPDGVLRASVSLARDAGANRCYEARIALGVGSEACVEGVWKVQ